MSYSRKDVRLTEAMPKKLLIRKHSDFIAKYGEEKEEYEHIMTDYLRMSGIYWGLTAMDIMGDLERMNKREIIYFVQECHHSTGGFSASVGHDPHILYTLSAIQILSIYNALDAVDCDRVAQFVKSLQQPDGSFFGDKWGEVDTRFSFCAIMTLSLIGKLNENIIDIEKAVEFILQCQNFDGGFGSKPGSESHAGLVYCCVGFLAITDRLSLIDADILSWWLCERQLPSGGLNGRPEKLPDVCYSWWVLASLSMLGRLHWLGAAPLRRFILASQDDETGGFADRPGDMPDPFHTLFGLAALSLLNSEAPETEINESGSESIKLEAIEPAYCLTKRALLSIGIQPIEKPADRF